ncbi:hypothetical protein K2Y00_00930 [Patescibacteria group bacterium]|nr:hypothetical protein [Patescibacteria group bacterium]
MRGIAVDIDNVLSATNIFWAQELEKQFGNPEGLTPEQIWKKYVLTSNVPHWQTPEAKKWMDYARHSLEFQETIPLIENANHVVNKIHEIIPVVGYITARWEFIRETTESWLWKHDFPRAPVHMRPLGTEDMHAMEWKASFLPTLYPEVAAHIDDDIHLLEYLPHDYKGTIFLYKHTKYPETPVDVVVCEEWDTVLTEVSKRFGHYENQ